MPNHIERVMQDIIYPKFAARMERSIKQNFKAGGRPKKWKVTNNPTPLLVHHILQNSINAVPTSTGIMVGTPVIYASRHNFGDKSKGLVQREFMLVQPADINYLKEIMIENFAKELGK